MDYKLELTPTGRLFQVSTIETPNGLRDEVKDRTEQAHQFLSDTVTLQEGVRISALFELLKANKTLIDIYQRDWSQQYLERYEAIRSGKVTVTDRNDDAGPPVIAIIFSLQQTLEISKDAFEKIIDAKNQNVRLINLHDGHDKTTNKISASDAYWHLCGRSKPFEVDTEYWDCTYKAGEVIDYSLSFSFDRCCVNDLPIHIKTGNVSLEILGKNAYSKTHVNIPLGTDQDPPSITLHEFIHAFLFEFSFFGSPENTADEKSKIMESVEEIHSDLYIEDLGHGLGALFCPEDSEAENKQKNSLEIQDPSLYWSLDLVMVHTGFTESKIERLCAQGRLMELTGYATRTVPRRCAYPAQQFAPGFDTELFRYLNSIAHYACSDWATHRFLQSFTTVQSPGKEINGWGILATPDTPIDFAPSQINEEIREVTRLPKKPIYPDNSLKNALIQAFETFANEKKAAYEAGLDE